MVKVQLKWANWKKKNIWIHIVKCAGNVYELQTITWCIFSIHTPHRQAHTDTHTDQKRSTVSELAFLVNCYKSMFIVYGSCSGAAREGATLLPVPPGQPWAGRGRHQGRWAAAHGNTPAVPSASVHGQNKVHELCIWQKAIKTKKINKIVARNCRWFNRNSFD